MEKEGVVMNWEMKPPAFDLESLVFLSGRAETHLEDDHGLSVRNHMPALDGNSCLVDLKLGRLGDFGDGFSNLKATPLPPPPPPPVAVSPGATRRSRSSNNGNQVAACVVDDCSADLSGCKDYHKKHKVCEAHSKAVKVTVEGMEKRFCQQCSKFHALSEFDEVKRSCRKRLDGHNKRRRKSHHDMSSGGSVANTQGIQPYMNHHKFPNGIREHSWAQGFVKSEEGSVYCQQPQMLPMNRQQSFLGSSSSYYKGIKQFPFLQTSDIKLGNKRIETSVGQPLATAVATQGSSSRSRFFTDGLIRVIDSDCALSLLSSSPQSSGLSLNNMDQIPLALPLVQGLQFNGSDRFPTDKALGMSCCNTDGVSTDGFSCGAGIVDDEVGSIIVANSGHAEFHAQGVMRHAGNVVNPTNGVGQPLHFSWQAHDHLVLVHYRQVSEVRNMTGFMANSSTYNNQNISFVDPQDPNHVRNLAKVYDPSWNLQSPGSLEEVSSITISAADCGNDNNTGRPENVPLYPNLDKNFQISDVRTNIIQNLDQQVLINPLSEQELDQDLHGSKMMFANVAVEQAFQSVPHPQPWSEPVDTEASPSWKDVLEQCSNSSAPEGENSNQVGADYVPKSSRNLASNLSGVSAVNHSISHDNAFLQLSENNGITINHNGQCSSLSWNWENAQGKTVYCQPSADNFSQKLSAARHFLLGSDSSDNLVPPTSHTTAVHDNDHHIDVSNSLEWLKDFNTSSNLYSPAYYGALFDQDHLGELPQFDSGLTVSKVQRFTIQEISPEWAYSTEGSKVIVIGDFLCDPSECTWYCLFDDIEVPVEILKKGVLYCRAPPHVIGKVPFCITSGNREQCSEVREFEYRSKPQDHAMVYSEPDEPPTTREELLLLARLARIVLAPHMHVCLENGVEPKSAFSDRLKAEGKQWEGIIGSILDGSESSNNIKDWILAELLKARLEDWLSQKCQNSTTATCSLTKHEQSIIHLIAGLGYEWALSPVLKSGIVINFRDNNGWTALHWAAKFGRERIVAALLAAGASAGAVTDPTSQEPVGTTAAAIAAARGHRGLAAYLSEAALTSHLSSLTLGETEISKDSANLEAEITVECISERGGIHLHMDPTVDQLSLKQSLAVVRNAAQAAARIQSAFRAHSFRKRQQELADSRVECGLTQSDIRGIAAASRLHKGFRNIPDHKLDTAATRIQRKYLSWKGRKDFLILRRNVVKIQAHVRGHQIRKKYKEFVWTVGVYDKVILRWRRKGTGLRGFRSVQELFDDEDILKVFRKQKVDLAIEEALSRVFSLVDSPEARQQYQRILDSYNQAKAEREARDSHSNDNLMQEADI